MLRTPPTRPVVQCLVPCLAYRPLPSRDCFMVHLCFTALSPPPPLPIFRPVSSLVSLSHALVQLVLAPPPSPRPTPPAPECRPPLLLVQVAGPTVVVLPPDVVDALCEMFGTAGSVTPLGSGRSNRKDPTLSRGLSHACCAPYVTHAATCCRVRRHATPCDGVRRCTSSPPIPPPSSVL